MPPQSNSYSIIRSFNLLRYLFLVLGFYPFYSHALKKSYLRSLLLFYCLLISFYDIFVTIIIILAAGDIMIEATLVRNVDFISIGFGEILISITGLILRLLYNCQAHKLVDFFQKWSSLECEYENLTGKQLKTMDLKKFSPIVLVSSTFVILLMATYKMEVNDLSDVLIYYTVSIAYTMNYLTLLYTGIIWNMMTIALQNTSRQLLKDYSSEECANSFIEDCDNSKYKDRQGLNNSTSEEIHYTRSINSNSKKQHYLCLWIKLVNLQNLFSGAFSPMYGAHMTFNFLHVLFMGFGWTGALYRYVAPEKVSTTVEATQILALWVEIAQSFIYILVGSTTTDAAQRAMDEESKKTLLKIIRRKKQNNLPNEQEVNFLKIVTRTKIKMRIPGYGRIDRESFCKILITWINYMIILLQFRNLIQDDSKDPKEKQGFAWSIGNL
ncbi:uncharacterized protein LOC120351946 [Nilaparvata lugens]|uniref:uncharacterized protein LOC120351946 n=1 Tax=Nilaparvata lugens TaxID=108931 RepID=UPI00193E3754|nr:uncharacterized protein LOC120351946 [Nilaparvata lugens]